MDVKEIMKVAQSRNMMGGSAMNGTAGFLIGFPVVKQRIIDDATSALLEFIIKVVLNPILSTTSTCLNVVNSVVFAKMGLTDGVTASFFILSISDGLYALVQAMSSIAFILEKHFFQDNNNARYQALLVAWALTFAMCYAQNTSLIVTTVISVVRCLCVTMPLKIKEIFTVRRQLALIAVLSTISAALITVSFSTIRLTRLYNPVTNRTNPILKGTLPWLFDNTSNVLYYGGFVTIIACTIILSISIRKSTKFIQSELSIAASPSDSEIRTMKRELQVVKTVTLIAFVFILCYLPWIVSRSVSNAIDVHPPYAEYVNFALMLLMLSEAGALINTNANFIFYVAYNARYREQLYKLFRIKKNRN